MKKDVSLKGTLLGTILWIGSMWLLIWSADSILLKFAVIYTYAMLSLPIAKMYLTLTLQAVKKNRKTRADEDDEERLLNQYYIQVRKTFGGAMKEGKMARECILELREYITTLLDKHDKHVYSNKKYENEAHSIYSMLKAPSLSTVQYIQIDDYAKKMIRCSRKLYKSKTSKKSKEQ